MDDKRRPYTLLLLTILSVLTLAITACSPSAQAPPLSTPPPASPTRLSLPSPTLPPSPAIAATPTVCPQGSIVRRQIDTSLIGKPLTVSVYLPPCFVANPENDYAVLYLLHGQASDDTLWQRLGLQATADQLITAGKIPPILIIMPREEYYLKSVLESAFGQALMEDVLPWVEASYPTCRQRQCRAIGGISRGATWAVQLGIENWQTFGVIGAHSLPGAPFSPARLRVLLETIPAGMTPSLYLDTGRLDRYRRPTTEFHETLVHFEVPHEWHLLEGAHEEVYWEAHLSAYLTWYGSRLDSSRE